MGKESIFENIYKFKSWSLTNPEAPTSGEGSIQNLCVPYTKYIKIILKEKGYQSILDLGHGDWQMWPKNYFNDYKYTGIDIVSNLSASLNEKMGNRNITFVSGDISATIFPKADILISKDCFQHMTNFDIIKVLDQIDKFEELIICNDYHFESSLSRKLIEIVQLRTRLKNLFLRRNPFYKVYTVNNARARSGNYRGINLMAYPFSNLFNSFELVRIFDFDAPNRKNYTKRVFHFRKK